MPHYHGLLVRRAQSELGIKPRKSVGEGGGWVWELPQGAHQSAKVLNPKMMSTLSTFSIFKENQRVTNSENAQKNQDAQAAQGFGGEHLRKTVSTFDEIPEGAHQAKDGETAEEWGLE